MTQTIGLRDFTERKLTACAIYKMKRCPQCNRVETDEALKFCRIDGATLVNDSGGSAVRRAKSD